MEQLANVVNEFPKKDIKKCCMDKINKILQKDELTQEDVNTLNVLCNIMKHCDECNEVKYSFPSFPYINPKEEGILLKSLFLGSENFEDWFLMRILFKLKMLEAMGIKQEIIK